MPGITRVAYDFPRGPFHSRYARLESQLKTIRFEHIIAMLEEAEDYDDKENAEYSRSSHQLGLFKFCARIRD
ncbi:hypothetical protein F5X98DRAFT_334287 [Xylaria grammica]|nr:hypothetical protein F5X98DRAFT_334287 [Xylaria grammica]